MVIAKLATLHGASLHEVGSTIADEELRTEVFTNTDDVNVDEWDSAAMAEQENWLDRHCICYCREERYKPTGGVFQGNMFSCDGLPTEDD